MSALLSFMAAPSRGTRPAVAAPPSAPLVLSCRFDVPVALRHASASVNIGSPGHVIPPDLCGVNAEFLYNGWNALEWQSATMRAPDPVAIVAPTGIRYPGGAWVDGFDWTKAVGATRDTFRLYYRGTEDIQALFGIDELTGLCATLGAAPLVQVDIVANDPSSAAALVTHINTGGKKCQRWQLGNEEYHSDTGTWRLSQAEYVSRALAYISAMQAAQAAIDGTSLDIYAIIHPNTTYNQFSYWTDGGAAVVDGLKDAVTGFTVHRYGSIAEAGPAATGAEIHRSAMLWPVEFAEVLDASLALMEANGAGGKTLMVTEWGLTHGVSLAYPYSNHVQCLSTAAAYTGALNAMARRPQIEAAYCFKLWGYDHQGLIGLADGGAITDPPARITPAGRALGLWKWALAGKRLASVSASSPTIGAPRVGWSRAFSGEPSLDALAAVSDEGDEIGLVLTNRHATDALDVTLSLPAGFQSVEARFLWGRAPDAAPDTNGPSGADYDFRYTGQANVWRFDQRAPGEVAVEAQAGMVADGIATIILPPAAVAVLRIAGEGA